jgi:hypothetical protein
MSFAGAQTCLQFHSAFGSNAQPGQTFLVAAAVLSRGGARRGPNEAVSAMNACKALSGYAFEADHRVVTNSIFPNCTSSPVIDLTANRFPEGQ